jgi:hypothetical protein
MKPLLQNNWKKMDWKCGSLGRIPTLQGKSPELKPQSLQEKREREREN